VDGQEIKVSFVLLTKEPSQVSERHACTRMTSAHSGWSVKPLTCHPCVCSVAGLGLTAAGRPRTDGATAGRGGAALAHARRPGGAVEEGAGASAGSRGAGRPRPGATDAGDGRRGGWRVSLAACLLLGRAAIVGFRALH
jgi:hypothetical protein